MRPGEASAPARGFHIPPGERGCCHPQLRLGFGTGSAPLRAATGAEGHNKLVVRQAREKQVWAVANCSEHPCAHWAPTLSCFSAALSAKEAWEAPELENRSSLNLPSAPMWVQGKRETGRR